MRYISLTDGIWAWLREREPKMPFNATTAEEATEWQTKFRAKVLELLGPVPPSVPLNPEVLEETDMGSYTRRKVIYDADAYASIPAYLLIPKDIKPGEERPGILACHGHGNGKIDICGVVRDEDHRKLIKQLNYDYAHQWAERGYVVIAPDWRCFGERTSPAEWIRACRDTCNVHYLAYGYQGYHLLALQINDARKTLDYLQTVPEVDPERIGCCGLSFGGTMTTYIAALEPRVKVACVSGYLSTFEDAWSMRGIGNFCGSQYMPGLAEYGDIPDVGALIAPKPLVVEMGEKDSCFVIEDMKKAYNHVRHAYEVMGYPERLAPDFHPGEHEWSGKVAYGWFDKWL